MLVKRNTNAGRAGRAPGGRDEGRVVSCGGLDEDEESESVSVSCIESEHRAQGERVSHEYR